MNKLELVEEYIRVWNEEGLTGLVGRFDDFFTNDYQWHPPEAAMSGSVYVGREGFEQYIKDVQEVLGDARVELDEVSEAAPDTIRVVVHVRAEGTSSKAPIVATAVGFNRFRGARACWGWATYDPSEAEKVGEAIARGEEAPL